MKNILIIGGVATGMKTAARLKRRLPKVNVIVLEQGDLISYGACGMPYVVSGEVKDINQLMSSPGGKMRDVKYFKDSSGIEVRINTVVRKINRREKSLTVFDKNTQNEENLSYDKLVIATGASPIKLPSSTNTDLKNIFTFWNPHDAVAIKELVDNGKIKNAVIVGAGFVGLELAENFHKSGVNVSVIEFQSTVLAAMLDQEMGAGVNKYLLEQNIELYLEEKFVEAVGTEVVEAVITDKRTIPADVVIISVGVRPNVQLAKDCGLELSSVGAIKVNAHLQTSDEDIYAGGDCVANNNLITNREVFMPMGSTANKHGRVIADHIAGDDARFKGIIGTAILRLMDWTIGRTGLTEKEAKQLGYETATVVTTNYDQPYYICCGSTITIKLIAEKSSGKVLGAQLYGSGRVDKRLDSLATAITFGATLEDLANLDIAYAPPYSSPIDNVAVASNVLINKLKKSTEKNN